jgi:16S rRNA (guanine(1405)-N(7))-methyltransferase
METEELEQLVDAVLKSPKYRNICKDLIRNIGRRELSKRRSAGEAIKATKNRLHQIGGAYFLTRPSYPVWLKKLSKAKEGGDQEFKKVCVEVMRHHQSTRERLRVLNEFYNHVFSLLPSVHSVVDVACGFHPLAIPWMPLSGEVKYYAYDAYMDLAEFLNGFLSLVDVEGYAEARDIAQNPPEVRADLAFALNLVPCLEQIEKSAGLRALESINADSLAISFPVRSLSGKKKGMREFYEAQFRQLAQRKKWVFRQSELGAELIFLVQKEP